MDNSLYFVKFSTENVLPIINKLASNKAHGHDEISIRMFKICGSSVCRPLQIVYKSCLDREKFPQEWKKANVVPVHKKNDKQLVKYYLPISQLPICGKTFERILYNYLFDFLNQNDLISPAQSGFKLGDSCIIQLLSITHEIYHSMGPLLLLIYINDLAENLSSNRKLFADDTSLFSAVRDLNTSVIEIDDHLKKIEGWAHQWKMSFNPNPLKQAQEVIFSRKRNKPHHPDIIFNGNSVKKNSYQKHLGMFLDSKLDFDERIKGVFEKISKSTGLIHKLQNFLPRPSLLQIDKSFVRPHLDYGDIICYKAFIWYLQKKLESIQYNALFIYS